MELMVAGTCNRLLHKKKHEKVEEENTQEWGKKLEGKSVENLHTSSLVKDACMAKEQNESCIFMDHFCYLEKSKLNNCC